jgi:hypothetical protein
MSLRSYETKSVGNVGRQEDRIRRTISATTKLQRWIKTTGNACIAIENSSNELFACLLVLVIVCKLDRTVCLLVYSFCEYVVGSKPGLLDFLTQM